MGSGSGSVAISVFAPAYNEAGNIPLLLEKLDRTLQALSVPAEVVIVDDGSTDGTGDLLTEATARYAWLRVIRHRRNLGLTEAMRSGFESVRGDTVVFLPADLEADPEVDVPALLGKLEEGYDVVAGWRQGRKDGKVLASRIYNWVSARLFGVHAHDMNWIKAFRREVLDDLQLRSDWHRFILVIAAAHGYRVGEVKTSYQPRQHGRSKFGIGRIPRSFLDVLVVKFLLTFSRKPMLFFGGLGLACEAVGGLIGAFLVVLYLLEQTQVRPLFNLSLVLVVAGLLLFLVGFLAELIVAQTEQLESVLAELRRQNRS
ncbi:MAG: glycosyltransferase family 2 protein [Anaerolineae bacterium]|nr:glycosyltransferase family 2 protein [Anaerolineae bacterium]